MDKRKTFPVLGSQGATVDFQFVHDHGEQAKANHYQTVERLAERGGLSWCELHAVVHNRAWQKMDTNEAMIAVRALEARYLAAVSVEASDTKVLADALRNASGFLDSPVMRRRFVNDDFYEPVVASIREALALHRGGNDEVKP